MNNLNIHIESIKLENMNYILFKNSYKINKFHLI